MRKRILPSLLASLALLLALSGCTVNTGATADPAAPGTGASPEVIKERGVLRVGCKTDVPGLGYKNPDTGEIEGLEADLADYLAAEIFELTPQEVRQQNRVERIGVDTATRESLLEDEKIDCSIATFTITDARRARFSFSDAYYTDAIGLMVKKDTADEKSLGTSAITSINRLDGKKIGSLTGATTRQDFLDYIEQNKISVSPVFFEYQHYQDLDDALKRGDIDVFAVDRSILAGYLDDTLTILPDRFAEQPYGIATLKGNSALTDSANQMLKKIKESGELDSLYTKWGLKNQ